MKILAKTLLLLTAATTLLTNCTHTGSATKESSTENSKQNSIYYWKTVFEIDSAETDFLRKHKIERIYLRMFDIAIEPDFLNGTSAIVPIATTKFISAVPDSIEIIPVTYITLDALKAMNEKESEFAPLIIERLLAMASYNNCGKIKEIQLDCDWTESCKESYNHLCRIIKDSLSAQGIELSITLRLHQLQETPPPADKAVLMLYNTGALKAPDTYNSILHIDDASPYIKTTKYPLALNYAYPIFSWGVKFKNRKFVSIVPYDNREISENEFIRYERVSARDIIEVKELVEEKLGKPANGNILYHLDYSQFKNYTDNEISKILNY